MSASRLEPSSTPARGRSVACAVGGCRRVGRARLILTGAACLALIAGFAVQPAGVRAVGGDAAERAPGAHRADAGPPAGERLARLPSSVVVTIEPGHSVAEVDAAAAAAGLVRVGSNTDLGAVQYVPAPGRATTDLERAAEEPTGAEERALTALAAALRRDDGVATAHLPVRFSIDGAGVTSRSGSQRAPAAAAPAPNDPLYPQQWGLDAVGALDAWGVTTGTGTTTVAVLDTGIDVTHPELTAAVGGGYDFVNRDPDATDDNGHGTHVAGVIAAAANNGEGIAGLAPGVRLLAVKVIDAEGEGYDTDIADGMTWAVDSGARILNLSLGGPEASPLLALAIGSAWTRGALVVAAAGNEGSPVGHPAADEPALAVAALRIGDPTTIDPARRYARASYSNFGVELDLAAPGDQILSSVPMAAFGTLYASGSGTSAAAPFVSATAALVLSVAPQTTATDLRALLLDTAVDLGPAGRDDDTGAGLVRADAALVRATGGTVPMPDTTRPAVTLGGVLAGTAVTGTRTITATASDNAALRSLTVTRAGTIASRRTTTTARTLSTTIGWSSRTVRDGLYTWRAEAVDAAGLAYATRAPILVSNSHARRTIRVSTVLAADSYSREQAVSARITTPLVARVVVPTGTLVELSLRSSSGKIVGRASGRGTAFLALGKVAAGRYTLAAVVERPGTSLRLTADWYR